MKKLSYAKSGVDISKIKILQNNINETIFKNQKNALIGHYAGLFNLKGVGNLAVHCDGVGTKVLIAEKLNKFDTIGIDAIAMNVNDLVCIGAKPLCGVDYLAIKKPNPKMVNQIMKGLVKGAEMSKIQIVGGETAIIPDLIKGGENAFDLSFTCVGIVKKPITGEKIKQNQIVLGLYSSGIHSNGYTLARKVLDFSKWGKEMLKPTIIYSECVLEILKTNKIYGIAHITGGAFSKINRLTNRSKIGIMLDSLPKPQKIFTQIAKSVENEIEMYKTFNMGIGMVLVIDEKNLKEIEKICLKFKIKTKVIGKTIKEEGIYLKLQNEVHKIG